MSLEPCQILNCLWRRSVMAAVLAMLCLQSAYAMGRIEVRLHPEASVAGATIYLHQIATIDSDDPEAARKIAQLRIDRAPQPGRTLTIQASTVARRLRRFGVDDSQFRMTAAEAVKVTRQYARVEPETVRNAVRDYILRNAPWEKDQLRVRDVRWDRPVLVAPGPVKLSVQPPKHTDWIGAIPFRVTVSVAGQSTKKITVSANIEVWSDVVVAAKPLGKFQPIGHDAIRIEKMNLARVPGNAVLKSEMILGRRTNRNIAPNSILRADQVELPPLVRRGDVVEVVAESPILKIAVKGMIKENAAAGERVRVVNLGSKKTIYAKVVDANTVTVDF